MKVASFLATQLAYFSSKQKYQTVYLDLTTSWHRKAGYISSVAKTIAIVLVTLLLCQEVVKSIYVRSLLKEPLELKFKLAVLNSSQILRQNSSQFVLKLVACRPLINA